MANRFDRMQPSQFNYQAPGRLPLNQMMKMMAYKQEKFDVNEGDVEDAYNIQLQSLQQDRATANGIVQGYQQELDNMVTEYNGDYSKIGGALNKLKRKIKRDFSPGGQASAIETNYNTYTEALKRERKRLDDGDINANQLQAWQKYTLGNYTGAGDKDAVTGIYNQLSPEGIAKYVSGYDLGLEAVKNLKPDAVNIEKDNINGGWIVTTKEGVEMLSEEDVQNAVIGRLSRDDGYKNMLTQNAMFSGKQLSTEGLMGAIQNEANAFSPFAYSKRTSEQGLKSNPWALFKAKEAGRNARANKVMQQFQPHEAQTRAGMTHNAPTLSKLLSDKNFYNSTQSGIHQLPITSQGSLGPFSNFNSKKSTTQRSIKPIDDVVSSIIKDVPSAYQHSIQEIEKQVRDEYARTKNTPETKKYMKDNNYTPEQYMSSQLYHKLDSWQQNLQPTYNSTTIQLDPNVEVPFWNNKQNKQREFLNPKVKYFKVENGIVKKTALSADDIDMTADAIDSWNIGDKNAKGKIGHEVFNDDGDMFIAVGFPGQDKMNDQWKLVNALEAPKNGEIGKYRDVVDVSIPLPTGQSVGVRARNIETKLDLKGNLIGTMDMYNPNTEKWETGKQVNADFLERIINSRLTEGGGELLRNRTVSSAYQQYEDIKGLYDRQQQQMNMINQINNE